MGETLALALLFLLVLAAFTRDTFVIVLVYLIAGSYWISRFWVSRNLKDFEVHRSLPLKVFPGESIPVQLSVRNRGFLPVIWMRVQDFIPVELVERHTFFSVLSLAPRQETLLDYRLKATKRGYYSVGPFVASSGDLLGMLPEKQREFPATPITVYPRVIPLSQPVLPSNSPLGGLRRRHPINEDPARAVGKRDYQVGDSLRRIDWKASAASPHLQVKMFESSISLEVALFLSLSNADYPTKFRFDAIELGVVVAASLSAWLISRKQSVGLFPSAVDPVSQTGSAFPVPVRNGKAHLIRVLDTLARIQSGDLLPLSALLQEFRPRLNWGTSVILITGHADDALYLELSRCQRSGLSPMLVLCGWHVELPLHRQRCQSLGIPLVSFQREEDLRVWQN